MPDDGAPVSNRQPFRMALPISDQRALFGVASALRRAKKGECLIRGGANFSSLIVLCSGMARKVRTFPDGIEQIVAVFIAGDILNAGEIVFRQSRNSVYALSEVTYVAIPLQKVNDLIATHPSIARSLWLETAMQAAIQQEWMIWLGRRPAQSRVAHFLCELSYRMQLAGRELSEAVEFPLTQSDLADALGMSTVHVNRSLQALRGQGLIDLTRSRLMILNKKGLYAVADFDPQYLEGQELSNSWSA